MANAPALPPRRQFSAREGEFEIHAELSEIGADLLAVVWGGTRPHIGAIGFAEPRPSLKNPAETSATSSVITFPGHKEDHLAKTLSEALSRKFGKRAVVTAGIHWDNLTDQDLQTLDRLCVALTDKIIQYQSDIPAQGR